MLWNGPMALFRITSIWLDIQLLKKIDYWLFENQTSNSVKFIERTTQINYISILNTNNGCYLEVGMIGGAQELSLIRNNLSTCLVQATIMHDYFIIIY